MPGKYLEYIKAGQHVVPIEITFLSTSSKDKAGKEVGQTSKWVEKNHWKEIKAMLKPAVEAALKYNEQPVEKVSKASHVSFGQEIGLGYVLGTNKDKSPFLAVLDVKKNCMTDDEDDGDEANENTRLRDYGGNFKNYTPTKVYISCAIIKKTASQTEDGKRLRKELGSINEDVRSYFQPSNNASVLQIPSGVDTTPFATVDKVNFLLSLSDSVNRKSGSINQALNQLNENSAAIKDNATTTSSDSNSDFLVRSKKKSSEDNFDVQLRKWRYDRKTIPNKNDSFWSNLNVEGSYYEERDEDAEDDADSAKGPDKGPHGLTQEHNMQDIYNLDFDDDTFSLPDIDTPIRLPTNSQPSEISSFATHTFNTFGKTKTPARNLVQTGQTTQPEKKKSPRKKSQHLSRPLRRESSDDSDLLNEYDTLLYDELRQTKKKKKRTNSTRHNASVTSITSDSYSGVSGAFEEAMRAFEYRNEAAPPLAGLSTLESFMGGGGTSSLHRRCPERKKSKEPGHITGFKKSPTISPPRMQKISPTASKVSSPVHKPTSPSKTPKTSPNVVRRIFPASSASPDITASPTRSRKDSYHSEVQVLSVKPKRIRKAAAAKAALTSSVEPASSNSKSSFAQIINVKKEKGVRKEATPSRPASLAPTTEELANDEIDPEMPILERMVFNVPPSNPEQPSRIVKAEPTASVVTPKLLTPMKKKSKFLNSKVMKKKSTATKKNEATQTVIRTTARKAKARAMKSLRTPIKGKLKATSPVKPASQFVTSTPMPGALPQKAPLETPVLAYPSAPVLLPQIPPPSSQPISSTSYGRVSTGTQKNSGSSGSDGSDDLFSFENLDKSPPKFSGPPVPPSLARGSGVSTESVQTQPVGAMMPPPAKRPPRTPTKNPVPAVAKKSATETNAGTRPQASTVLVQGNPNQLSTFDLLSNPNLLRAGMGLLNKFNSNQLNSAELDHRMGLRQKPPAPARPVRCPSPDITEGPPKAKKGDEAQLMPAPARPLRSRGLSITGSVGMSEALLRRLNGPDAPARSDTEDDYLSDPEAQENGEALVRELMSRYNNRDPSYYEPQGDEFDMSQRSYCMMNVVPDYQQKSRLFKIHSKNITALTRQNIVDQFQAIIPEMVAVFQGAGKSDRHKMYLLGRQGRDRLKEMNVSIPFHNDQGMTLITLLFEYFVPAVTARQHWTEYINYVMLPEAFIRIYARVNDLSYVMAETEMRYGACYDDPDPSEV